MTIPSLRFNIGAPFPATVGGSGPIVISKFGAIWTVSFNIVQLAPVLAGYDPATKLFVVWDTVTSSFQQITAQQITAGSIMIRIITAAGDVTVLPTDNQILMNKTIGAATNILLPASASRSGQPITVKDYKGDANTRNITFVANGAETIDGLSNAAAAANGTAVISTNYGRKSIFPLNAGGWYT